MMSDVNTVGELEYSVDSEFCCRLIVVVEVEARIIFAGVLTGQSGRC